MGSVEIFLTYVFAICVVCSYGLFFGHLFLLCCSSMFCLDNSQAKMSEDNCYITLKNEAKESVLTMEDCGISTKNTIKTSIETRAIISL